VLTHQIQAIQQAMRDVTPVRPPEQKKGIAFDAQTASTAIAHLKALLESGDGDAIDAFLAVESILTGRAEKSRLEALGTAINEFDFEGARIKLDEITQELGANRGQNA